MNCVKGVEKQTWTNIWIKIIVKYVNEWSLRDDLRIYKEVLWAQQYFELTGEVHLKFYYSVICR